MNSEQIFGKLDRPSISDKVLLLTHNDMDAAGVEILCRLVFNNLTVKHLNNSIMSQGILDSVKKNTIIREYDMILIADISCTLDVADEIDNVIGNNKLVLLDHHDTALDLNKYRWAAVHSELLTDSFMKNKYIGKDNAHSSGASLMYDYLKYCGILKETNLLKELIHIIAAYDTWDWNYLLGKEEKYETMDKLCDIYGLEMFVEEMFTRLVDDKTTDTLFNEKDIKLLSNYEDKVNEHLAFIKDYLFEDKLTFDNDKVYNVVWCFTGSYLQETFALMKEVYKNRDLYIINYGTGISFRTDKPDLHIGNFVKDRYSGGGHAGAGGFSLSHEVKRKCLEISLGGTLK